jgi:hypothetical protein
MPVPVGIAQTRGIAPFPTSASASTLMARIHLNPTRSHLSGPTPAS